ncbi:MAG: ribosomal L7Ae/L30e/S12e/Gadd45 family protein [Oscillospiraceae bacterium]|jgi:large subunit ribosomal protein L7A|nr:ribosomal L7Ae/L30e/S12e/Gadd45 family protein [Oscillospiraceae bacterium]
MLEELRQAQKVVGSKQARRALRDRRAKKIYIARDADPRMLQPLVQEAVRTGVRVEQADSMKLLGEACGIAVGAAIAVVV